MSDLTPIWCAYCGRFVPKEREPHVTPQNTLPHYAKNPNVGLIQDNKPPPDLESLNASTHENEER